MTRAEKIQLLQSYIDIEKSIKDLDDKYEELFAMSTKITPSYSEGNFGGGFDSSKVENACVKLAEVQDKKAKLVKKKNIIDMATQKLHYSQRKLIEYVSVEGHTLGQASRHFKRTYSNTKVSFNNAIDRLEFYSDVI